MAEVIVFDRTSALERMNEALEVDVCRVAIVQIDMHVRQMDPDWSSFPQDVASRILPRAATFLDASRSLGLPIIHVMLYERLVEAKAGLMPRSIAIKRTGMPGSPYGAPKRSGYHPDAPEGEFEWDLMPILAPAPTDYIVNTKRQATSSFLSTDLESLIRCLDVDTFFVIGINTNNCVLNFACDAANRCWTPILITDCVGSVHGEDLHAFALLNVSRTLGFAMSAADALRKLHAAQVGNTFSSSRSTREGAS